MESRVLLNVTLEVYKAITRDQRERCLHALAELGKFILRKTPNGEIGSGDTLPAKALTPPFQGVTNSMPL